MHMWRYAILIVMVVAGGCQVTPQANPAKSSDVVLVVHGVDGAGIWYRSLIDGLSTTGRPVELVEWGGPLMILPNLQLPTVHESAQNKLRERILAWHHEHPDSRIDLVGHSAGCGVILFTLAKLPEDVKVHHVLLLAPAVSSEYDISPALHHVRGAMHSFHSPKDQMLLHVGTSIAGTYDNVWGKSAGLNGFKNPTTQPTGGQFVEHAYQDSWQKFGHDGGHFGYRSKEFVIQILSPLLQ